MLGQETLRYGDDGDDDGDDDDGDDDGWWAELSLIAPGYSVR